MNETARGRAALQQSGLCEGDIASENSISPGNSIRGSHGAAGSDKNGKEAGIWLSSLTIVTTPAGDGGVGTGRMGNEDARFVALQGSRTGESLLAGLIEEASGSPHDNPGQRVWVYGWR
jgi:hypothetical protein